MKRIFTRILIAAIALTLCLPVVLSQERKSSDATRKKEKIERTQKKNYREARKKTLKHRREIQTEDTRKRMDAVDKKAQAYNNQDKLPWYKRMFKKKRR